MISWDGDVRGYRMEPADAEIISSIGDALSLVRAARERSVVEPTAADVDALIAEVERPHQPDQLDRRDEPVTAAG